MKNSVPSVSVRCLLAHLMQLGSHGINAAVRIARPRCDGGGHIGQCAVDFAAHRRRSRDAMIHLASMLFTLFWQIFLQVVARRARRLARRRCFPGQCVAAINPVDIAS